MPRYRVKLYYSSYITKELEAEDSTQALKTATLLVTHGMGKEEINELVENAHRWEEADEAERITDD